MSQNKIEMRVIAGIYRHRKLMWPSDYNIRPTKDRVKEAIFSALGDVSNKTFLDLYSGSGAIGIEAISRGCIFTDFVDNNLNAIKCIKGNLKTLNVDENIYKVHHCEDFDMLTTSILNNKKFDIIYLDPPYKQGKYQEVINYIIDNNLLNEFGVIVTECGYPLELKLESKKHKTYKYGEIFVNIFWR